jgi:hypothetical protein
MRKSHWIQVFGLGLRNLFPVTAEKAIAFPFCTLNFVLNIFNLARKSELAVIGQILFSCMNSPPYPMTPSRGLVPTYQNFVWSTGFFAI